MYRSTCMARNENKKSENQKKRIGNDHEEHSWLWYLGSTPSLLFRPRVVHGSVAGTVLPLAQTYRYGTVYAVPCLWFGFPGGWGGVGDFFVFLTKIEYFSI